MLRGTASPALVAAAMKRTKVRAYRYVVVGRFTLIWPVRDV